MVSRNEESTKKASTPTAPMKMSCMYPVCCVTTKMTAVPRTPSRKRILATGDKRDSLGLLCKLSLFGMTMETSICLNCIEAFTLQRQRCFTLEHPAGLKQRGRPAHHLRKLYRRVWLLLRAVPSQTRVCSWTANRQRAQWRFQSASQRLPPYSMALHKIAILRTQC
ncbi:hypothetical protein C6341_g25054 [Phytophthora cactorum]|nr:hypothetical protein C6341_g25054 [Phytophthora cactorum]